MVVVWRELCEQALSSLCTRKRGVLRARTGQRPSSWLASASASVKRLVLP